MGYVYEDSIFKLKRGLAVDWETENPVLDEGEPGLELDTHKIKFGDGLTAWHDLPYASGAVDTGAMHFIGPIDQDPETITSGYKNGDVVLYQSREYVWGTKTVGETTISKFFELGDETRFIEKASISQDISLDASSETKVPSTKAAAEALAEKQETLVSGVNIKTINNQSLLGSGNVAITTYQPIPLTPYSQETAEIGKWRTKTIEMFMEDIINDPSAVKGMAYLSTVGTVAGDHAFYNTDIMPSCCELKVEIMQVETSGTGIHKIAKLTATSTNNAPYLWTRDLEGGTSPWQPFYNFPWRANNGAISKVTVNNTELTPTIAGAVALPMADAISASSTNSQIPGAKSVYDSVSAKQDTLVSGANIKTINNSSLLGSGNISIKTLTKMPDEWCGSELTTQDAVELMLAAGVKQGEGYIGGVYWSDLDQLGLVNAEVKAFVITDDIIQFDMTSADTSPYAWFYNSAAGVWRAYAPYEKNPYNSIKQIADYLFEVQYSTENIDYNYANNYFKSVTADPIEGGGCTGVVKDGKVLRQLDWYYNEEAEFIVHRPADIEKGFYGSVGVAAGIKDLTKETVESGLYNKKLKMVPFIMTDGINDKGLYIQSNVVQRLPDSINVNPGLPTECCITMLARYILDHCATIDDVKKLFTKDEGDLEDKRIRIFDTSAVTYGYHFLIAQGTTWTVLEFKTIDNPDPETQEEYPKVTVPVFVTSGTGENKMPNGIMTNFRTTGLQFGDGRIGPIGYVNWNSIEEYGIGVERYDIATKAFTESKTLEELRTELKYTNTYDTERTTKWYTEYCDPNDTNLTVMNSLNTDPSDPEDPFTKVYNKGVQDYQARSRRIYPQPVWQTVHSAIYDLSAKSFNITIQERFNEIFKFSLVDSAPSDVYTKSEIDAMLAGDTPGQASVPEQVREMNITHIELPAWEEEE